jgi:hypothetical protein
MGLSPGLTTYLSASNSDIGVAATRHQRQATPGINLVVNWQQRANPRLKQRE